ncbi:hemerythrin domain-containing protein [Methylobacterium tarhaniae]|uniref:hemerythrin domain-containing protein n=1 Tax=Methylobacterium tarhaniae TaxID=1187852 RepID=UPI003D00D5CE
MDIWRLIDRDHANITQLIREIPNALNGPGVVRSRERLLSDLIDELHVHAVAVDAGLMTLLERHEEGRALVGELRREHRQAAAQLDALAQSNPGRVAGWLDRFEDVTYLVDQHLHRHGHELLPLARRLLSDQDIDAATTAFVRAKGRALRADGRGPGAAAGSGELALAVTVGLVAAGAAWLAWRSGLLRGAAGTERGRDDHDLSRGQPRSDRAASSAPGQRVPGENLRARQDRLLDEAIEETFPASDPISPKRITR